MKSISLNLKTLRKHTYSNILKISPSKTENFEIKKNQIFFILLLKNIDCGYSLEPPRRGGSNEYPRSMIFYIKVGFKGVQIIWACFRDDRVKENYKLDSDEPEVR